MILANVKTWIRPTEGCPEMRVLGSDATAFDPGQSEHFHFFCIFLTGVGLSADFYTKKRGVYLLMILCDMGNSESVLMCYRGS